MANDTPEVPTLESWQVWRAFTDCIKAGHLAHIYGCHRTAIYDYCKAPDDPGKKTYGDPLQRLHKVLKAADINGYGLYVDAAIKFLQSAKVDSDLDGETCKISLATITEEMLADYPALNEYHKSMKDGVDVEVVERFEALVIAEIKRTTIRYRKDMEAQNGTLRN